MNNPIDTTTELTDQAPSVPEELAPEEDPYESLTPRQIVAELDKYIVGQHEAKRAVAIALRNRWRRLRVEEERAHGVGAKTLLPRPAGQR